MKTHKQRLTELERRVGRLEWLAFVSILGYFILGILGWFYA